MSELSTVDCLSQRGLLPFVLSFLDLREISRSARGVNRLWQEASDGDPRWLPVIAPPSLVCERLQLTFHGRELRRLYREYWEWWEFGNEADSSALDGFFSLAPWRRSTYPTPWLHRMVYRQQCPSLRVVAESSPNSSQEDEPVRKRRRCSQLQSNLRSLFFQTREFSNIARRRRLTYPIEPEESHDVPLAPVRILLQPVNFRGIGNGRKHEDLPDHDVNQLNAWNSACLSLLEVYFGSGRVTIPPLVYQKMSFDHRRKLCRREQQGLTNANGRPVIQIKDKALAGAMKNTRIRTTAFESEEEDTTVLVYCVAPDLYGGDLAWCYSAPVRYSSTVKDTENGSAKHKEWVVSTFRVMNGIDEQNERLLQYCSIVLYAVLMQVGELACCENDSCAMQISDSMEEAQESRHFILCPGCIRKLQLCGALEDEEDIPALLQRLHDTLSKEPFASACQGDIQKLQEYGCRTAT